MTIHLGPALLRASRDQPGRRRGNTPDLPYGGPCRPYSVLLRVGFTLPVPSPGQRCALTAPFHPCRAVARRFAFCGTFPGLAPAGRYPAPRFRGARTFLPPPSRGERPSGRLARAGCNASRSCNQQHVITPGTGERGVLIVTQTS